MTSGSPSAGQDALADLAHRVLDAVQLLPTPFVGLGEVEVHAAERAGLERVAIGSDGVALRRGRRVQVSGNHAAISA